MDETSIEKQNTQGRCVDENRRCLSCLERSPFLEPDEAAEYLRLNKNTLRNKRCLGDGPPYRKHGRRVVYHIDDLEKWSAQTKRTIA